MAFIRFNNPIIGEISGTQTNVGGVLVEGAPTPIAIMGSIQPSSSRDLELLPEGRRVNKSYTVYTRDEIKEGYRLTIYGDSYTCMATEVWQNGVLPHYKAIMQGTDSV
jgi:hypothetical protein